MSQNIPMEDCYKYYKHSNIQRLVGHREQKQA